MLDAAEPSLRILLVIAAAIWCLCDVTLLDDWRAKGLRLATIIAALLVITRNACRNRVLKCLAR